MNSALKIGYAEVNGTKLYYEITGKGDPIILIHGNVGDNRHWDYQFEAFGKQHQVLRYDLRGFGKSSLPQKDEPYSHYEDLKHLMDYHEIDAAYIGGLSMGSGVAINFVLSYPERVKSLIAAGPWIANYDSEKTRGVMSIIPELLRRYQEEGKNAAIDYFIDYVFSEALESKGCKLCREIGHDYSGWQLVNMDPRVYLDTPVDQLLDTISVPTLIVTADHDHETSREAADLMAERIPNSKKIVFSDSSHFMHVDKPEEFNKLVLEFISSLS